MPINKREVTWTTSLDLSGIPSDKREEAKQSVMDYLKEQMLTDLGRGLSPVTGRQFKGLSEDYKAYKATLSPDAIPNMELNGNLLDALEVMEGKGSRITIGWTDPEEAIKAFNHTTGDTVPTRPLIPEPKGEFRAGIMRGIEAILDDYREER